MNAAAAPSIPDFTLLRRIGQGGYGDVWLARGVTGVLRAVKIVWRDRFVDGEPFEREFRGVAESMTISSEACQLALLHAGRNDHPGFFYYVMELADDAERGRDIDVTHYVPLTLKELRARRGRLPVAESVRHGVELARALAALHRHGLLHRDIKPSNGILVNGVAKLADVGLVAAMDDAHTFVGTEGFVPPEGPGSARADVFALGKVLYELATGIDRADFPQIPADLGAPPERAAFFALNDILLRACDASPAQRYRDGAELLADLEALQAGRPRDPSATRAVRRSLGLAVAAALAVIAVGWTVVHFSGPRMASAQAVRRVENGADHGNAEARRLTAQAWQTVHSAPEPSRPELDAAHDLARRAAELDPASAEAWAVGAYIDSWYVAQNIDRSAARREAARVKAARALKLAPDLFEARFAQANMLARSEGYHAIHNGGLKAVAPIVAEAEPSLRALLELRPEEPRVLYALGQLLYLANRTDESAAVFDRLARHPDWRVTAYAAKGWTYAGVGRWDEAVAAAEQSIALKPFFGNVVLRLNVAQNWTGDLDLAKRTFDLMPREELREDIGMLAATILHWWRREPEAMLRYLRAVPREWIQTNGFTGPKDYWIGQAYAMSGRTEAARLAWRAGLRLVDQRLAEDPNAGQLLFMKAQLHALLGEREATRAVFDVARDLFGGSNGLYRWLLLGEADPDRPMLKGMNWARLKYWPELDPVRGDARFEAELAAAAADPRRSPHAPPLPRTAKQG